MITKKNIINIISAAKVNEYDKHLINKKQWRGEKNSKEKYTRNISTLETKKKFIYHP